MYNPSRLGDVLEALDDLHSAVSDGTVTHVTSVTRADLREWLHEIVYLATQTLEEMDASRDVRPTKADTDTPGLHLVRKSN